MRPEEKTFVYLKGNVEYEIPFGEKRLSPLAFIVEERMPHVKWNLADRLRWISWLYIHGQTVHMIVGGQR